MSITLLQLRTEAKYRSDMTNSTFIDDSEWNSYINSGIADLHDLLIACYMADYYTKSTTFVTVANQENYALPSDFYQLRGVDIALNGTDYFSVSRFNFNERNRNTDMNWGIIGGPTLRYRLVGNNLKFTPAPDGVYQGRIWYTPVATKLVADGDMLADLNQYYEYVVVHAALMAGQKEETDISVLAALKADLRKRIESMASGRDADKADSIQDIYAENDEYYFFRS